MPDIEDFDELLKMDLDELIEEMEKMPTITKASVQQYQSRRAKKICFSAFEAHRPRRSTNNQYAGAINLPFQDGFNTIFPFDLWRNTRDTNPNHDDAAWRSIKTDDEFRQIENWCNRYSDLVFMRDNLTASIALQYNLVEDDNGGLCYSEIGALENQAKEHANDEAIKDLTIKVNEIITELDGYKDADYICAVPCHPSKDFDLPTTIANIVGPVVEKEDITSHFEFGAKKESIKEANLDEKWTLWDNAKVTFSGLDLTGKTVVLIDDCTDTVIT